MSKKYGTFTSSIVTSDGTAATGTNRSRVTIQNLSTVKLYVKKGTGCTSSDFSVILAPGAATDDGYGGSAEFESCCTAISIKAASGSPRCVVSIDSN
jgi:hypothetical protein